MHRAFRWIQAAGIVGLALGGADGALAQTDLLPDIVTRASDMYDHDIVQVGSERRLRLSNGTANAGDGKLYLRGGMDLGDGTQEVLQRVYRTDGSFYELVAGAFVYHPEHLHIHFEDWAEYRLREYLPGGGVGSIISVGRKVSFCIVDFQVYDSSLPNFSPVRQFVSCTTSFQGLTVGWVDVYTKSLPDQYVDITGVPPGVYWLESVADPFDHILEKDETNNITRIPVSIDIVGAADLYEPDDSLASVQARSIGTANSPNIGPCNPQLVIPNLSIHELDDEDYYRFYLPGAGTASDFVRIDFTHVDGDLELLLLDDAGSELATSQTSNDFEEISLDGRSPGWYVAHVRGFQGGAITSYTLTIDPSQNTPPEIEVTQPPAGNLELIYGQDTYQVQWNASDLDADPTWVTFYLNTQPVLDGNELKDFASVNTPGTLGQATINSSAYPGDTYWVYCEVTDGGTRTGDWSEGTVSFVPPVVCVADLDGNGNTDVLDFAIFAGQFSSSVTPGQGADFDSNGIVDIFDFAIFLGDWGCAE